MAGDRVNEIKTDALPDWENVYVFISSTFNDMHAERDFLVKRVFPELSAWCEERRLRLIDIDLRWGVTEEDSEHNKRVVEVCLRNIDKCRPFFLCFLGQRYGWIPGENDINNETFDEFPKLRNYLGCSVTEMEIRHALLDPMHKDHREAVKYAFFFLREESYLKKLVYPPLRAIYTNESENTQEGRKAADEKQKELYKSVADTKRPVVRYRADWDQFLKTPELRLAKSADAKLSEGRLYNFRTESDMPLASYILDLLKDAIILRFGNRELAGETALQKELAEQSRFVRMAAEGYIPRESFEKLLDDYVAGADNRPLFIMSKGGIGKTSFLANYILESNSNVIYRFLGISDHSYSASRLVVSILQQIGASIPENPKEILIQFSVLLADAAERGGATEDKPLVVVIDALDQLTEGGAGFAFLPKNLPACVKLIVSCRSDAALTEGFINGARSYAKLVELPGFDEPGEKLALVETYLNTYLKKMDDKLIGELIGLTGTHNPLFLKIILGELRVFGSYDNLAQKIRATYGVTPTSAFNAVLERLENDPAYHSLDTKAAVENVFCLIAHSRYGLSAEELGAMLVDRKLAKTNEEAVDAVHHLARQMRAYVVWRDGRLNFFFNALYLAVQKRYIKNSSAKLWHDTIAKYFALMPADDPRRLMELAYQYYNAVQFNKYEELLCDYRHHASQLGRFGVEAILEDCELSSGKSVALLRDFYCLAGVVLRKYPDQLPSQLWGRLLENGDPLCDALIRSAKDILSQAGGIWLRPKLPFFDRPGEGAVIRVLKSDTSMADRFSISPDEAFMVTPTGNGPHGGKGAFFVWDLDKGRVIHRLSVDAHSAESAHFSPNGKYLVGNYGFCGQKICVWDADSFEAVCEFSGELPFHMTKKDGPNSIAYADKISFAITPDSKGVVAGTKEALTVFDIRDGSVLSSFPYKYDNFSYAFCGNVLAVGNLHPDRDNWGYLRSWGKPRGYCPVVLLAYEGSSHRLTILRELEGHTSSVFAVALSQDGQYAASADQDGIIRIWSVKTGSMISQIQTKGSKVCTLSFSPDGTRLMAGGREGALNFYSINEGELRRRISCHMGSIEHAVFTHGGSRCIALCVQPAVIKEFSLSEGETIDTSSSERYNNLGKNQKSGVFVASSYINYVERNHVPLDMEPFGTISFFDADTNDWISDAALLSLNNTDFPFLKPDGSGAVSKNDALEHERSVNIGYWDFGDFPVLKSDFPCTKPFRVTLCERPSFSNNHRRVQFSSDGQYAVCTPHSDNRILLYSVTLGKEISAVQWKGETVTAVLTEGAFEYEESLHDTLFEVSPDGTLIYAFNSQSGYLRVYKASKGKAKLKKKVRIKDFKGHSLGYGYSTDRMSVINGRILVNTEDFAAVIELENYKMLFQLDKKNAVDSGYSSDYDTHAALHPGGRLLFLSRRLFDEKNQEHPECLEVWDVNSGKFLTRFFSDGHISNVIAEADQATFACANGQLCTLFLEGFKL